MKKKILFSAAVSILASLILCSCNTQDSASQEFTGVDSVPVSSISIEGNENSTESSVEAESEIPVTSAVSAEVSEQSDAPKCSAGEESKQNYSVECIVKGEEKTLTEQQLTEIYNTAVEATSEKTDFMLNTIIVPDDVEEAKANGVYINVTLDTGDSDCLDYILLLISDNTGCACRGGGSKIVISGKCVDEIYQILNL